MLEKILCKSALHQHEQGFPTFWDVNPYRGCSVGCRYCFAQYSHRYLNKANFFSHIIAKTNVADILDRELSSPKWKGQQIKIGGVADLYQHAEAHCEIMPQIYRVLQKHRNPVFIQTKSALILRDLESIRKLAQVTTVDIATSVTTLDESLRKILEPGAAPTMQRIQMLEPFQAITRKRIVCIMPVIPYVTDSFENLHGIYHAASVHGANSVIASPLSLWGPTKPLFLKWMQTHFANHYAEFSALFENSLGIRNYWQKKRNPSQS